MTAVYRQIIDHPSAWTPAATGGKQGFIHRLDADLLQALDDVLARTRHIGLHQVTRAQFDHPLINKFLDVLRDDIMNGRGLVIVSGITPERYDAEQMERIYWGFSAYLGTPVRQSQNGDMMGYVQQVDGDIHARGYRSNDELRFHCDTHEGVGLMCVRRAASGGESRMASTLTIHNEIFKARPDLLDVLYEGYYLASGEVAFTSRPVTPTKVPVFCYIDGLISCMTANRLVERAAKTRGVSLTPIEREAMDFFVATAERPDVHLQFLLEPGEMMLWQNFTNVHSRTSFENSVEYKRLLLRVWYTPDNPRSVVPAMHARAEAYEFAYQEKQKELAAERAKSA